MIITNLDRFPPPLHREGVDLEREREREEERGDRLRQEQEDRKSCGKNRDGVVPETESGPDTGRQKMNNQRKENHASHQ